MAALHAFFLVMGEALKAVRKPISNESWVTIKEEDALNEIITSTITVKACLFIIIHIENKFIVGLVIWPQLKKLQVKNVCSVKTFF